MVSSSIICLYSYFLTQLIQYIDDSHPAQAYEEVTQRPHEAKWSHELIGGAAAYEAAKAYEEHSARNGKSTYTVPIKVMDY